MDIWILVSLLLVVGLIFAYIMTRRQHRRSQSGSKPLQLQPPPELLPTLSPEVAEAAAKRVFPDIDEAIVRATFERFNILLASAAGFTARPDASAIKGLVLDVFGQEREAEVMTQLNKYASTGDKWNNREQIQLDIIRLSDGRIDRLPELVKAAKSDFRDIMMNAEAPNYEEYVSANVKKGQSIAPLNPEDLELRRALDADLRQFVLWLIQHVK